MNKKRVDQWIPKAKEALEAVGIAEKGKISKRQTLKARYKILAA